MASSTARKAPVMKALVRILRMPSAVANQMTPSATGTSRRSGQITFK